MKGVALPVIQTDAAEFQLRACVPGARLSVVAERRGCERRRTLPVQSVRAFVGSKL